jgi:hypothetical protein
MLTHFLHVLAALLAPPEVRGDAVDRGADVEPEIAREAELRNEGKDEGKDQPPPKTKGKKNYDVDVDARLVAGGRLVREEPVVDAQGTEVGQPVRRGALDLRQARVGVDARYRDVLRVRATLELSDLLDKPQPGMVLRNAWANVRVHPGFQIRAGQFKRPYSRLELRGFSSIPFIGRGLFNRIAVEDLGWGDRALGVMLWGDIAPALLGLDRLRWQLSVTNHAVSGAPHGFDAHARLTYDPTHWLSFGTNVVYKSVQDPLADEDTCRATWKRGPECRIGVFAAGSDVAFEIEGLYASVEVNLAQDWLYVDESPWMLGALGYASYDLKVGERTRLQPVIFGEFVDSNMSYAESEAVRAGTGFNILWTKRLRIMPQIEFVQPHEPVTSFNRFVARQVYGLWIALQL